METSYDPLDDGEPEAVASESNRVVVVVDPRLMWVFAAPMVSR